jgi:TrpR-related protein YerC/YecD
MKRRDVHYEDLQVKLYEAILSLKTKEECEAFFTDLCTPAELEAFADRWEVARMLCDETPYRTINDNTGVSVTTITRVARCLHRGEGGYRTVLKRLGFLK